MTPARATKTLRERIGIVRRVGLFAGCALALVVAACGSRPEAGFLSPVAELGGGAATHTILVATTRRRDDRPGTLFGGERSPRLDFAKIAVSVPPTHEAGEIEWAAAAPGDPNTDFVVRQASYLEGEKAFVRDLNARLASKPRGQRRVFLFIHGYNTMFAEGLYRFTQVVHDSKSPAVPVLFTWASRGELTQYVYDNNSATAARDDLERLIRLIFDSDVDEVNILAHSMGNWVTVEALRQIKISGNMPANASKLGHLILAAPDIDIDVFKAQMRRFGKPKKNFLIVLSKDDKALELSDFIAGGRARLGDDANTAELAALGATVIDMTDVEGLTATGHDKFARLAAFAPQLQGVLGRGVSARRGPVRPHEFADYSLEAIVKLPITIISAPFRAASGH